MKIGIITLPLHTNYGGILQAYALQTILERMGHHVELLQLNINKPRYRTPYSRLKTFVKGVIKKYVLRRKNIKIFEEKWLFDVVYPVIRKNTNVFINHYLNVRLINSISEIHQNDYDAFVVGSDQIWRPKYNRMDIEDAYLKFAKDWSIKRISYAPSFGTDTWEYTEKQTIECANLIKLFDVLTVREYSAVKICKKKFGVEAVQALDPTMLLSVDDYQQLFNQCNVQKSAGNLHCYILNQSVEKQNIIDTVANKLSLKPFSVHIPVCRECNKLEDLIQPPVEQWIRAFFDAEYVVTDSFHACVFCILFHKQFIVCGNKERGMARFYSLLKTFGLENRMITDLSQFTIIPPIDYTSVDKRLEELKEASMSLLQKGLN